jgi:2-haloacid dehalogenase
MPRAVDAVVFDVGNVLIEWDPRHLYRRIFDDAERMEWFLTHVCSPDWNARQDAGRPWDEAIAELVERFPGFEGEIRAFRERWHEMVPGTVEGMPELFAALGRAGVPRYAITNFSSSTFAETRQRFAFLTEFVAVAVSGELGLCKPDAAIYRWLIDRCGLTPSRTVFVDDSAANVDAARRLGFQAVLFEGADAFTGQLAALGLEMRPIDDAA